jgi:hypothetical protein
VPLPTVSRTVAIEVATKTVALSGYLVGGREGRREEGRRGGGGTYNLPSFSNIASSLEVLANMRKESVSQEANDFHV